MYRFCVSVILVCALCLVGMPKLVRGDDGRAGRYHTLTIEPSDDAGGLQVGVTFTVWLPPTDSIRGIIVHQHGCGVGACRGGETAAYDLHWQELARKWDCALLGPSYHQAETQECRLWCDPRNGSNVTFLAGLEQLAQLSGHTELSSVPWCLWGHSGGGFWASLMQMEFPERIVAIWFQSGTAFGQWTAGKIAAPDIPAAAIEIPIVVAPGRGERDHERFHSAWRDGLCMFKAFRLLGAPAAFAPDPHSGHETRDARYLAIPFFDACLELRLPLKGNGTTPLQKIDQSAGRLAAVPVEPSSAPYETYRFDKFPGEPSEAVWLPNQQVASAWSQFVHDGTVGDTTPPPAPFGVEVDALTHGVSLRWQAHADFESGIAAFQIFRNGKMIRQLPEAPPRRFGRPLFQKMSYHDTPESPLPEMSWRDEAGSASDKYAVATINSVGIASTPTSAKIYRDLVFAEINGQRLTLDLHLPNAVDAPLLIWIHGGGWRGGSKARPPLRKLTDAGYALASISYRFTDKAIFPAQIHDCKAAVRWLRAAAETYRYRAKRIAVAGSSAGGHLALLLGVTNGIPELEGSIGEHLDQSSTVHAVIDYYGPADFMLRGKTQPERAYSEASGSFALLGGILNGQIDTVLEKLASPVTHVTPDDPPLLIFHGNRDEVVLLDQSQQMAARYQQTGLDAKLIVVDDAGHGGDLFFTGPRLEAARRFLERHQ